MKPNDLPKTIREFAETHGGITELLTQFNIEVCEVCNEFGVRFTSGPFIWRKNAVTYHGWFHSNREPRQTLETARTVEEYLERLAASLQPSTFENASPRFCVADKVAVSSSTKRGHQLCPRCGKFGTGVSVWRGQKRFWHESNRSCYLGSAKPKKPKTVCPRCGKPGRPFKSKMGDRFIRHTKGQCRVTARRPKT